MSPRILIFTIPHGAAHTRIAHALRQALLATDPNLTVEVIDMLAHTKRWFRAYYNSYEIPLKYWPSLWAWIERQQHQGNSTGPGWIYREGSRPLAELVERQNPDIVVATETGICEILAMIKRRDSATFYFVGVDGIDADRAWAQPEVDLYTVAPDPVVGQLEAAGVPTAKIVPCGMLIDPAFGKLPDRLTARQRLGVDPDLPLLLVLAGGAGFAKPRRVIPELRKVRAPLQAVFVAGKNARLRKETEILCQNDPRFRALGWVDNMHEWLVAADLVLNKPSGLAIMEAMSCGLPFLAIDPLPGNERRHCELIERWRVGCWVRRHADLAPLIERLLASPAAMDEWRANTTAHAHPRAAEVAAEAILKSWKMAREGKGQTSTRSG